MPPSSHVETASEARPPQETERAQAQRQQRLAVALRKNLLRRKAALASGAGSD